MALPTRVVSATVHAALTCRPVAADRGYLRVEIDSADHRRFRVWAAQRGVSMTTLAKEIIENAIFAGARTFPTDPIPRPLKGPSPCRPPIAPRNPPKK